MWPKNTWTYPACWTLKVRHCFVVINHRSATIIYCYIVFYCIPLSCVCPVFEKELSHINLMRVYILKIHFTIICRLDKYTETGRTRDHDLCVMLLSRIPRRTTGKNACRVFFPDLSVFYHCCTCHPNTNL